MSTFGQQYALAGHCCPEEFFDLCDLTEKMYVHISNKSHFSNGVTDRFLSLSTHLWIYIQLLVRRRITKIC